MNIKPNLDLVLIEVQETIAQKNGLFLPPSAADKNIKPKGIVKKAGEGRYTPNGTFIPTKAKEGDEVCYTKDSKAVEMEEDGVKYVLIPESNILYWIEKEKPELVFAEATDSSYNGRK